MPFKPQTRSTSPIGRGVRRGNHWT